MNPPHLRTWIEINKDHIHHNTEQFFSRLQPRTRLMAVVKSNAYGHGLVGTALALEAHTLFARRGWFGVDSIVEGIRLRREGVKNPILVLGFTLPAWLPDAKSAGISVTISNLEALRQLAHAKARPSFHLKVDTGMHRQGFFVTDLPLVISFLKRHALVPEGVYTHFAMAKDKGYPAYTHKQFKDFMRGAALLRRSGFRHVVRHAAATGGTLLYPEMHLDMVRIGMGLYGYQPSPETALNISSGDFGLKSIELKPVLTWKTVVGEVKKIPAGSPIGYDLTERVMRPTKIAVLPVGYWHGFDRGFSSVGEVLIGGCRRKVLGRVSMDMIVVDGTDTPTVQVGDVAVLIGRQGREKILADEFGAKIGTSCYEVLTRTNPLIKRFYS